MQGLPNVGGVDLTALKAPPDLPLLQYQHPVRGQGDALQDVGGEQDRPVFFVPGDQLVQVLRALEVQPVYRLVQQEERPFQGEGGDQKRLFLIAGGQVFQQSVGVVLKVKAPHQFRYVGQFHFVRRRHIGQVLPEGEILEGVVLGKDGVPAQLEALVPKSNRLAVQADAVAAEALMESGQGFQKGGLPGPVQADQPHHLMGPQLEGEVRQHVFSLAVPGAEVLQLQDVPAHGQLPLLSFFAFFQEAQAENPKAAPIRT